MAPYTLPYIQTPIFPVGQRSLSCLPLTGRLLAELICVACVLVLLFCSAQLAVRLVATGQHFAGSLLLLLVLGLSVPSSCMSAVRVQLPSSCINKISSCSTQQRAAFDVSLRLASHGIALH